MKRLLFVILAAILSAGAASAQIMDKDLKEGMKYREVKELYNYKEYTPALTDRYTPAGAGVASFFIPGLGQMLSREVGRGFAWLGGHAAAYLVTYLGMNYYVLGTTSNSTDMAGTGALITLAGCISMLTVDICSIVDAVRVAKVKNMYEQDLRRMYSLDVDLHPSVNYIQTADGVQPTAGLTLALNF